MQFFSDFSENIKTLKKMGRNDGLLNFEGSNPIRSLLKWNLDP